MSLVSNENRKRIAVIGLGYVGLPTAVVFAYKGYDVIGVDTDSLKVESINRGVTYIKEPDLSRLLIDTISSKKFKASTSFKEAIRECDVVLICVPTPVKKGIVDLSHIINVLQNISKNLRRDMLIVIESTVPPGTTCGLAKEILENSGLRAERDFYLAHVPERIAPGKAIQELLHAPRVVGGVSPESTKRAMEVYRKINNSLLATDATTAEFVKLIENTYRDINIAFANLLALIAERLGIDVYEAIKLANTHPRVNVHWPGSGVGGPCLTKDPYMLAALSKDFWGVDLITLARRLNDYMPFHMVELVERVCGLNGFELRSAKVTVLGVAYKGGVDDTRETPAKVLIEKLLRRGAAVVVHDPYAREAFGARYEEDLEKALEGADALVVVTDHPEYKNLDLKKVAKLVKRRIIIDGRRVIEPDAAISAGFKYYGVGYGVSWRA